MARLDGRTRSGGEGLFPYPPSLQNIDESIPGEILLALSVLRQAIADVKQPNPTAARTGWRVSLDEQKAAVAFLHDPDALDFWAELLGLDRVWLQRTLLAQAGLSDAAPRNGQRPGPAPHQQCPDRKRNLHHA